MIDPSKEPRVHITEDIFLKRELKKLSEKLQKVEGVLNDVLTVMDHDQDRIYHRLENLEEKYRK